MSVRQDFIDRVNKLEKRYRRDRYQQDCWFMPVAMLKQLRAELVKMGEEPKPKTKKEISKNGKKLHPASKVR